MERSLRHGFTTGACAAAAALGAARMLREQDMVDRVELFLPAGFAATFALQGQRFSEESAACFVVKDAGDDPDVTHGVEVHAEVAWSDSPSPSLAIEGGPGIGRVTKPGLAVPPGEWAINPVPRRMIAEAVQSVFPDLPPGRGVRVALSIPDGEARARRTLNERLGIVGGLSILGTTGVVRPVSHEAWTDTIDAALDVARATGCRTVVLSTGRTSELGAQRTLALPAEAFIMMGDFVGHALEACHRRGFPHLLLAAQFAKLAKIAAGHERTHVRDSRLDLAALASTARRAGLDEAAAKTIELANTARGAWEAAGQPGRLAAAVAAAALAQLRQRAPGATIEILLIAYDGTLAGRF
jgi:cobalt-precorrin-5B (C1)-methyltransferase